MRRLKEINNKLHGPQYSNEPWFVIFVGQHANLSTLLRRHVEDDDKVFITDERNIPEILTIAKVIDNKKDLKKLGRKDLLQTFPKEWENRHALRVGKNNIAFFVAPR